jgi:hypothetical protein
MQRLPQYVESSSSLVSQTSLCMADVFDQLFELSGGVLLQCGRHCRDMPHTVLQLSWCLLLQAASGAGGYCDLADSPVLAVIGLQLPLEAAARSICSSVTCSCSSRFVQLSATQ